MAIAATAVAFALHARPAEAACSSFSGSTSVSVIGPTGCMAWTGGNGSVSITNFGVISSTGAAFTASGTSPGFVLNNSGTISSVAGAVNISGTFGTLNNAHGGVISSGSTGIMNTGTIATLSNSGVIQVTGAIGAAIVNAGGTITSLTNASGGTITSAANGVDNSGVMGTLSNASGGTITASGAAVFNGGAIGAIASLTNSGLITSTGLYAVFNSTDGTIGTLTNTSTGILSGSILGIANAASITSIVNNGTVSGSMAVENGTPGTIGTITNTGVFSGAQRGLWNLGHIDTVNNSGTISGSAFAVNNTGTITSLVNGGLMSGATALYNTTTISSLTNTGTITGSAFAINYAGGTFGSITNAGLIAGNISNSTGNALNISGGSGSTFGTLTGFNGATGTVTNTAADLNFNAGNLLLNDTVNVGSHTVNNVGAALQVNGPMTITGNYTQGAAATLLVGATNAAVAAGTIGSDSGYGRLVVTGTANVAAGSAVTLQKVNAFGFAAGQRFVVIDATGTGTNYNASTLRYSIAGVSGLVVTGAAVANGSNSDLVLTLASGQTTTPTSPTLPSSPTTPTTPAASLATAPNARASLGGLAHYTGLDPALLNLFDASLALGASGSTNAVNQAGKQLAPTSQTNSAQAAAAPTFDVLNIVSAHADSLRLAQAESGISTGDASPQWGVWGQAFGGHASRNESDQVDGYSANYGGLMIGADRAVTDRWRVGGVFSYSNAAINNTGDTAGDSTRVNAYGLIGYASYVANRWYANLSAGVVQQRYDTNRIVSFPGVQGQANGSFNGQQYVARGEVGYPLALGPATVTPLASLTYSYLHQSAYTETGGNGAALAVDATHLTSVSTDLGAKIERQMSTAYGVLVPELTLAWRHEYDNTRALTNATFAADPSGQTSFTALGASPITNLAVITAGVTLLRERNLSLTARYEAQLGSGYVAQAGTLRLKQLF